MTISYKCEDCGDVDSVYVACVRIDWNAHEQDWDIDPNDKASNLRCGDCRSWNVFLVEGEEEETMETKVITHGRKDTDAYFRQSGVLSYEALTHTPFLVFVIDGGTVDVRIVGSAEGLVEYPPDTQVMGQWKGQYRSDFFQFTVDDALKAIADARGE
jgi:hypothetical protein